MVNFYSTQLIKLGEEYERYSKSKNLHEAGYDAYITGIAYITFNYFILFQVESKKAEINELTFTQNPIN